MKPFKRHGAAGRPSRPAMGFQPAGAKRPEPGGPSGGASKGPFVSKGVQKVKGKDGRKGEALSHKIRGIERLLRKVGWA